MGLVALTVVALAGGAYAATQNSGPSSRQAFLADVAKRLHVSPQQLSSALNGAYTDQLQAEVKAGRLTQAQANVLEQRLKSSGAGTLPFGLPGTAPFHGPRGFGRGFGPGGGPGGGGPGGPGPGGGPGAGGFPGFGALPAAASYLGLTGAQLRQQLNTGKSLAQIATAKGKTASGLEQAMTASVKSSLDKAVAAGHLTAAQETQALSRWSARLSKALNSTKLGFRPRGGLGFLFRNPPKPGSQAGPGKQPGSRPGNQAAPGNQTGNPPASAPVSAPPAPPAA